MTALAPWPGPTHPQGPAGPSPTGPATPHGPQPSSPPPGGPPTPTPVKRADDPLFAAVDELLADFTLPAPQPWPGRPYPVYALPEGS